MLLIAHVHNCSLQGKLFHTQLAKVIMAILVLTTPLWIGPHYLVNGVELALGWVALKTPMAYITLHAMCPLHDQAFYYLNLFISSAHVNCRCHLMVSIYMQTI